MIRDSLGLVVKGLKGAVDLTDFLTLPYSMKAGRVVILLAGRHAGKKAIIVKQYDDGKKVSS